MSKKLVVITGASSGIGYALAQELASRGEQVLAVARRGHLLEALQAYHPNIDILVADIALADDRQKIIDTIKQKNMPVNLIHNAAIAKLKAFQSFSDIDWQQGFALNLEAPLWLTKACMPYFDHSRVLHISSGLAHRALAGTGIYSMTKAALYMLYQIINTEMNPEKVIAGSLRPGVVDTAMQQKLRSVSKEDLPDQVYFQQLKDNNLLRKPTDVASYIADVLLNTDDLTFKKQEWNIDQPFKEAYHG